MILYEQSSQQDFIHPTSSLNRQQQSVSWNVLVTYFATLFVEETGGLLVLRNIPIHSSKIMQNGVKWVQVLLYLFAQVAITLLEDV